MEVAPELGSSFDGVVAPEDIAVYGGLCALATFNREEMKRKVLDNSSFKNFLDLVPQVWVAYEVQYQATETTGGSYVFYHSVILRKLPHTKSKHDGVSPRNGMRFLMGLSSS